MSDERVQIIVRVTKEEKESVKEKAKENGKSMNQFIIDKIIADTGDGEKGNNDANTNSSDSITKKSQNKSDGTSILDILKIQLENKDKQLDKLQTLLDQQQQLSLSDKSEKEQLKIELQEVEEDRKEAENKENIEEDVKQPWWKFWE